MRKSRLAALIVASGAMAAFGLAHGAGWPARGKLSAEPEPELTRPALEPEVGIESSPVRAEPPPPRFIPVSGDVPAWVAPAYADTPQVILYMHGMCGEPRHAADWALAAAKRATVISLRGDVACQGGVGTYWRGDPTYLDYRITKAIRSVGSSLHRSLDESSVLLLGYSQGAQRAEDLAWTFPKRYRRVGLMSGPNAPRYDRVSALERLAIVRGAREYEKPYREAATLIDRAGVPAAFFELPGARHGDFGSDGPATMARVLDFLLAD